MGKALVIKGVNFETNKLTTVSIEDVVPCTGIELDKSTYTLTAIGDTVELNATVTPTGTTDVVEWSTSNSAVATVANGVVTCTGIGSATITATCGTQTATCAITATNTLTYTHQLGEMVTKATGDKDFAELNTRISKYSALFNTTQSTTKKVRKASGSIAPAANIYPILLGANASTVIATVPSGIKLTCWFLNSNTPAEYSGSSDYAKVISGDANEYDSSVPNGNRTLTVPSGADSAVFTLYKSSEAITEEEVLSVTIVAS